MSKIRIILILWVALSGCAKKAATPMMTDAAKTKMMTATDTLTYLALGDSYTIGQSVPATQCFPNQLAAALIGTGKWQVPQPTIIATTGWTTDNLINAIANSGLKRKFSMVTLLIGVNDQYQQLSQDNYKVKFEQVLNTAIGFAGGDPKHVFVLSIPDWGVTPFAGGRDSVIGLEIDQFNAINKTISTQYGVNYLDITPISRQASNDLSLVAPDGLHPSVKMYSLWVQKLEQAVLDRFKK
jgi:lysophospholipase L1-like esterase